jgi:hypothetical protein
MKSKMLEAYQNMPEFLGASKLNEIQKVSQKVWVTESVDNEVVDILVDKKQQEVKIRVDGRGRGPAWKFWKDQFEATTGTTQLLSTSPIDRCIIRCSTNRSPCFLKVLGVVSVDTISKRHKWIPFHMVDKFAKTTNMSPMPTVFEGPLNLQQIKDFVNKPVLGVKRNGILVISNNTPTQYVFLPVNVDETTFEAPTGGEPSVMGALAEEFSVRAFDESHFKDRVRKKADIDTFVKDKLIQASESLLLMEYVERGQKEAGANAEVAGIKLKEAVVKRANKLWKRYA